MVMSIKEEISSLEQEMLKLKGAGSKDKKKKLQKKIDSLKESETETPQEKKTLSIEEVKAINGKAIPPYKKVTPEQIQEAEKAGKLCGVDFSLMTASIRD